MCGNGNPCFPSTQFVGESFHRSKSVQQRLHFVGFSPREIIAVYSKCLCFPTTTITKNILTFCEIPEHSFCKFCLLYITIYIHSAMLDASIQKIHLLAKFDLPFLALAFANSCSFCLRYNSEFLLDARAIVWVNGKSWNFVTNKQKQRQLSRRAVLATVWGKKVSEIRSYIYIIYIICSLDLEESKHRHCEERSIVCSSVDISDLTLAASVVSRCFCVVFRTWTEKQHVCYYRSV